MNEKIEQLIQRAKEFNDLDVFTQKIDKSTYESLYLKPLISRQEADPILLLKEDSDSYHYIPLSTKKILEFSDYKKSREEFTIIDFSKKYTKRLGQSHTEFEAKGLKWDDLSDADVALLKKTYGENFTTTETSSNLSTGVLITHIMKKSDLEQTIEKISDTVGSTLINTGTVIGAVGGIVAGGLGSISFPSLVFIPGLAYGASVVALGAGAVGLAGGTLLGAGLASVNVTSLYDKTEGLYEESAKTTALEIAKINEENGITYANTAIFPSKQHTIDSITNIRDFHNLQKNLDSKTKNNI